MKTITFGKRRLDDGRERGALRMIGLGYRCSERGTPRMIGIRAGLGYRCSERGAAYLIMTAFIVMVIMIVAALGIDVARKYRLEQLAQDTADRAALAGAQMCPDEPGSRRAAIQYIIQSAGAGYMKSGTNFLEAVDSDDIQVSVANDNSSCTVGVIVFGAWDAMFMPMWVTGDPNYGISRYSIAVTNITWTSDTIPGDPSDHDGGPFALYMGEPSCNSDVQDNNIVFKGNVHSNGCVDMGDGSQDPEITDGGFTYEENQEACNSDVQLAVGTIGASDYVDTPEMGGFLADVTLDQNNAAATAWYSVNPPGPASGYNLSLDPGADATWYTADDITHPDVTVNYAGGTWSVWSASGTITGDEVGGVNIGSGLDIKFVGAANVGLPNGNSGGGQNYWYGSLWSTGVLTFSANNSEIRAVIADNTEDADLERWDTGRGVQLAAPVAGKDNPGIAVYSGTDIRGCNVSMNNGGNAVNIYGIVYTPAQLQWYGAMGNSTDDGGTDGWYDRSNSPGGNNGFIKGSVICGSFDSSGPPAANGLRIWYDGDATNCDDCCDNCGATPERPGLPKTQLVD